MFALKIDINFGKIVPMSPWMMTTCLIAIEARNLGMQSYTAIC